MKHLALTATVVALVAPLASAQLELEYNPTAETFTLTGTDSGNFNPLVSWQTGIFGGFSTTIDLVDGTHFSLTPASTIDTTLGVTVWDDGAIQLEMLGLTAPSGYTFEGLGTAIDASALSTMQADYLAVSDGLSITLFNGSGFAPVTLSVAPAPGALALFGTAALAGVRRRR